MTYRGERDEVFSSSRLGEASKGLFSMAGGWGNVSGPGLFMFRVLFSGTTTAIFMGMAGATLGAVMYDTAGLPFMISSAGGFMLGILGFYRDALRKAVLNLERYPRLLQLHLDMNYPSRRFDLWRREELVGAAFRKQWTMQSMLICAWLTAQPALDQINEEREQAFVEQEREASQLEAKA